MTTDEETLPPVVARMWGRERVIRRGPRPSLDLTTVVDAALGIADAEGLAGVTMNAVASRLGVAPMSLYRYVGSKDELLTLMTDAAAPEPPARDGQSWREYATVWTLAQRDYLLRRPWVLDAPRLVLPVGPRVLRWLENLLAALDEAGLNVGESVNTATVLSGYAFAQADLARHASGVGSRSSAVVSGQSRYTEILAEVVDPADYPILGALARGEGFGSSEEWGGFDDFDFGLTLLCDGVQKLIDDTVGGDADATAHRTTR